MDEIRMMAASGIVGYGFTEEAFRRGLDQELDFIGCDAGSMDPGPYYLGAGIPFTSRPAVKRDVTLMLEGALSNGVPLLIGSAGGGGGRPHVAWLRDIVEEVAAEQGHRFRMAVIQSEQDKDYLLQRLAAGKIRPLGPIDDLTRQDIEDSHRVVAMMGVEPYIAALQAGAQVVIAGRSSDSAIFAAMPVMRGFDPGPAWHLAKIIECAGMVVEPKIGQDCVIGRLRGDHFLIEPGHPDKRCLRVRIAAHNLYENPSPYELVEPDGVLETTHAHYEQVDPRTVKVSGSRFIKSPTYTVKLEGVKQAGFRTIFIAGIRDPILIDQIDDYLETVRGLVKREVEGFGIGEDQYQLTFRRYGKDAVMGALEPLAGENPHELGIVIDVLAETEEISRTVIAKARYGTLHSDFPGRMCIAGNLAIPFSPSDIPVGMTYAFNVWHVMEIEDPLQPFPMELVEV
jgi:hypothetical protein